jgi:hypothetical protein
MSALMERRKSASDQVDSLGIDGVQADGTLFSSRAVLAALERKFGAAASHVFVESVWGLLDSPAPSQSESQAEPAQSDTPLQFPCPFLGCNATRIYEGGKPLFFGELDTCPRCDSRIAVTPEEKAFAKIVARGLL